MVKGPNAQKVLAQILVIYDLLVNSWLGLLNVCQEKRYQTLNLNTTSTFVHRESVNSQQYSMDGEMDASDQDDNLNSSRGSLIFILLYEL